MGAEAFTVLAILEARDRASEFINRGTDALGRFSATAKSAADTARVAGEQIDQGLLQTASGADALDLADARVAAAQQRLAAASREQAAAERDLLTAQQEIAAGADVDAAAADRQVAASDRLAASQKRVAAAEKDLSVAQKTQADTATAAAAKNDVAAQSAKKSGDAAAGAGIGLSTMGKAAGVTALGMAAAGVIMVKAAGNFQDSTTHLVTDAGESAKNLAMVQAGILQVSTATGTSAADITNAAYHIESAGYHGAAGLTLLKVAAEGARVGGADLDTVSRVLVGTMNAYGAKVGQTTSYMNQLIATVGAGDMRMQDLASSLSAVAPVAAAAKLSFSQVGGAIATMTAQGMTAQQATQDLAHLIRSLQAPSNVASNEMRTLGLSANEVSRNLGRAGLTGTLQTLTQAVLSNTHGGSVFLNYMKQMTPQAQSLARAILTGSISTKELAKATQGLTPQQAHLVTMFKASAVSATGLKQTFTAAMEKMTGGATGLNVALMLGGKHAADFAKNVGTVGDAARKGGANVDNWSKIQSTFNFKMESAKTAVENTGIAIGSALLPAATSLLQAVVAIVTPIAEWTAHHRTLTLVLFGGVAALAATIAVVAIAAKTYKAITGTISTVKSALQAVGVVSRATAATQAAAAGEAATAETAAASESSTSWVAAAARTVGAWVATGARMIAQAAVWVAQNTAKVAIIVAENVAGAATTAAAWVVANAAMLAGIGLLVVAIGLAVAWIITHWKTVVKVFDEVINWIKAHWRLLLEILTGPIGLAIVWITGHWQQITRVIGDAINWVKSHWHLIFDIITGPIGMAVLWVIQHWHQLVAGTQNMITSVVSWFRRLPSMILSAVGNLGNLLYSAGRNVIQGLINGVTSMIGAVGNAIGSIASTIRSFLPFSPAKQGPLSGSGDPGNSGRSIARNLARGITAGAGMVASASHALAGAVQLGTGAPGITAGGPGLTVPLGGSGGAGGGGTHLHVDLRGAQVMSERDMDMLVSKLGRAVATKIGPGAGLRWSF